MNRNLPLGEPISVFQIQNAADYVIKNDVKPKTRLLLQFNDSLGARIQFPMEGKELDIKNTFEELHKRLPVHWKMGMFGVPHYTELKVFLNPYPDKV